MGKIYPELDERLRKFIARQSVFFVATAPTLHGDGGGGHINISPKGYRDTFAVLSPRTVAYLDLTGSGAETIAHLRQNGQITIMFCSFDNAAKVLRLYGTGAVVLPGEPRWDELAAHFPRTSGAGPAGRAARAVDHRRGRAANRRLLRVRGACHGADARAKGPGQVGRHDVRRRAGRLSSTEEHSQHRRPARAWLVPRGQRVPAAI